MTVSWNRVVGVGTEGGGEIWKVCLRGSTMVLGD